MILKHQKLGDCTSVCRRPIEYGSTVNMRYLSFVDHDIQYQSFVFFDTVFSKGTIVNSTIDNTFSFEA
jgi:hypothetical protein